MNFSENNLNDILKKEAIKYEHAGIMYADVPGISGYEVNSNGILISYKKGREFIKNLLWDDKGNPMWSFLHEDGRQRMRIIYRVMGEVFIQGFDRTWRVTHIDGDVTNNALGNLLFTPPEPRGITRVGKKWKAIMHIGRGKALYFGLFETKEEAYQAFFQGYLEYHGKAPW